MSEDGRFSGSSGTPAGGKPADQDYGFFTTAPAGRTIAVRRAAPSSVGHHPAGPPPQGDAPPPAQFRPPGAKPGSAQPPRPSLHSAR